MGSGRELELYFGPQHLGMVGNFSITLKVEGDRVVKATANPGYLHRGFEKLMEYRTWIQNFPMVCRINVVEPDSMEMIYAMAVEKLAGIEVPERAQYIRSIYLELARVTSHLFGLWAYSNMLGFDTPAQWAMYHRDLLLDLFEELTGGRV
ncbi:MAG: NADH-quinone oxidoreductase subunit D, partial [Planctomycetes bacterium SM23_65]